MAICVNCDEQYPDARRDRSGFDYCIVCAPLFTTKPKVFLADVSKSNPTVTCNSENVCVLSGLEGSSDQSKASAKSMISLPSYSNDKLYKKD